MASMLVCPWPWRPLSMCTQTALPRGQGDFLTAAWTLALGVFTSSSGCTVASFESESLSVVSNSLWSHGLYSPWNSLGQNTRVGSLSLLQGIFPIQGLNSGLPHCRQILYQPSYKNYTFNNNNNKLNLKISKGLEKTFFPNMIYKWQTNVWKYS